MRPAPSSPPYAGEERRPQDAYFLLRGWGREEVFLIDLSLGLDATLVALRGRRQRGDAAVRLAGRREVHVVRRLRRLGPGRGFTCVAGTAAATVVGPHAAVECANECGVRGKPGVRVFRQGLADDRPVMLRE